MSIRLNLQPLIPVIVLRLTIIIARLQQRLPKFNCLEIL